MSRYEWSQQQRMIETKIRAQKDVAVAAKASGDMTARREAQKNINALQAQYEKITYIKGNDVVLVKDNGEYITTMKNGAENTRVKNGRKE